MAPLPPQTTDRMKSLTYVLAGLFFVLVLIEKSLGFSGQAVTKNWSKEGFKNIGNHIGKKGLTNNPDPFGSNEWEDDLAWEEEALEDAVAIQSSTKSTKQSIDDGFSIPEITLPEDRFPESGKQIKDQAGYLSIYFLKFYGQGKNSQSQLVKVTRQFNGGDPIHFILNQLAIGPNLEEKSKGVLNSLPRRLKFDTNYKLEEGILHISFSKELEIGGSPEILKDRLDQLCYSFVGNFGIKGVVLYIGSSRLRTLGGDGMTLPDVLVRNPRKVILF